MKADRRSEVSQSTQGFEGIFIHSSLDEAELTPHQFRIFAHLARRASSRYGQCYSSVGNMSMVCMMKKATVRRSLVELQERGMLTCKERPGFTNLWFLEPPDKWLPLPKGDRGSNGNPYPQTVGDPPQNGVGDPPQKGVGEGTPREGNPKEGNPTAEVSAAKSKPVSQKRKLTDGFMEAYLTEFGRPYVFQGVKDGKAADRLLGSGLAVDDIITTAQRAWKHLDWFNCKQAVSLAGLASRYNEICAEIRNPPKEPNGNGYHRGAPDKDPLFERAMAEIKYLGRV